MWLLGARRLLSGELRWMSRGRNQPFPRPTSFARTDVLKVNMIDYVTYLTGRDDDVLVLELAGRLDEHTADFLIDCLTGHIQNGASKIVLDCHELSHVTSVGLARWCESIRGSRGMAAK